jgi:hypothetical protein
MEPQMDSTARVRATLRMAFDGRGRAEGEQDKTKEVGKI